MSVVLNSAPIPVQDPIAQARREEYKDKKDPREGFLTSPWLEYFTAQAQILEQAPARVQNVALSSQSASVGATDFSGGALSAGLYRWAYYARITTPASVSSSLTVSVDWLDAGVTVIFTGAAITGNTTATYQSDTQLINVQNLSPVRYTLTYASAGTPMSFSFQIVLEEILA